MDLQIAGPNDRCWHIPSICTAVASVAKQTLKVWLAHKWPHQVAERINING
jgi:hypothetical protein